MTFRKPADEKGQWPHRSGEFFHEPKFGVGDHEEDKHHTEEGDDILPHGPVSLLHSLAEKVFSTRTTVKKIICKFGELSIN